MLEMAKKDSRVKVLEEELRDLRRLYEELRRTYQRFQEKAQQKIADSQNDNIQLRDAYDNVKKALALYALQSEVVLSNLGMSPVKLGNTETATIPDMHSVLGVNLKKLEEVAKDYAAKYQSLQTTFAKLKDLSVQSPKDVEKLMRAAFEVFEQYTNVFNLDLKRQAEIKRLQEEAQRQREESEANLLEHKIKLNKAWDARDAAIANRKQIEAERDHLKGSRNRYKGLYRNEKRIRGRLEEICKEHGIDFWILLEDR